MKYIDGAPFTQVAHSVPGTVVRQVPPSLAPRTMRLAGPYRKYYLLWIIGVLLVLPGWAAGGDIREFPYPFSHVISFASDVDSQTADYGRAFHRTVNETLGLPVSDSLWVMARNASAGSGFFKSLAELNDSPSGIPNHPVYGLLLREWHRGNIDHFHSWQDDSTRQIRNVLSPPIALSAATTTLTLPVSPAKVDATSANLHLPQHLRLVFDAPPPDDLFLVVKSKDGRQTVIGQNLVKNGKEVQFEAAGSRHIVEILFGVSPDVGIEYGPRTVKPHEIGEIELHATSCARGCPVKVTALERDNFSRLTAKLQSPLLKAWNVRPAVLTSHGGWTYHQGFGAPGDQFIYPSPSTPEDNNILKVATTLADDKNSHAYHSDMLRDLGVLAVWPLLWGKWPVVNYARDRLPPPLSSNFQGFYTLGKTVPYEIAAPADYGQLTQLLSQQDPLAAKFDPRDYLCLQSALCYQGAQGGALGFLINLTLAGIDSGQKTNVLWHTHFGTAALDPTLPVSPITRIHPKVGPAFRKLANYYYDLDGSVGLQRRAWVVPANVWFRYRVALAHAGSNVKVDQTNSAVTITRWLDPVTRRAIPDPAAGTRDLHGLTIYVPDPDAAKVSVGRQTIRTFTRNPPDQTGRKSITIVDNHTPTVILDEVKSSAFAQSTAEECDFSEPIAPVGDAAYGKRYFSIVTRGATGMVRLRPSALELWNTTHLHFAYRKPAGSADHAVGKLFIELEMDNGYTISVVEGEEEPRGGAQFAGWRINSSPALREWRYVTLATSAMKWVGTISDSHTSPVPLPIGRVREIRLGLRHASPGERLDLDGLMALRPDGNGEGADRGKLVSGQVTYADGSPLSDVRVEAKNKDGTILRTSTNRSGYYYFYGVLPGSVLAISSLIEGQRCTPLRGQLVDIRKNEAEIDINLATCAAKRSPQRPS